MITEILKEKLDNAFISIMEEYQTFDLPGTLVYYIKNELICLYEGKKNDR